MKLEEMPNFQSYMEEMVSSWRRRGGLVSSYGEMLTQGNAFMDVLSENPLIKT